MILIPAAISYIGVVGCDGDITMTWRICLLVVRYSDYSVLDSSCPSLFSGRLVEGAQRDNHDMVLRRNGSDCATKLTCLTLAPHRVFPCALTTKTKTI